MTAFPETAFTVTARVAGMARYGLPLAVRALLRDPSVRVRAAKACDDLGGAFHKAGQVLATRADLLSESDRAAFARLCDRATPEPLERILPVVERELPGSAHRVDPVPLACGAVAQIHRARFDGRRLVLKIQRPGAARRFRADLAIARRGAAVLGRIPRLSTYPLVPGLGQIGAAVDMQLDFRAEARTQRYFREALACEPGITVPETVDALCGRTVIAMDHVADARRIDHPLVPAEAREAGLRRALQVLYAMIFTHGLVHCDMHPANLLVTADGDLVLLDFGYVAALSEEERRSFARLFLAIAMNDPRTAAEVVIGTAERPVRGVSVADVERDLAPILERVSGATAGEFQICGFVLSLFETQRRHGLRGRPGFTMAVLALLTLEGLLRAYLPVLDFQREAFGHVVSALEERPATAPARKEE